MNKGYPTAPTNIAIGNVQFFKNLSIGVHFNFGVQGNGDFRRKATFKPKKTQNLMANNEFSTKFYYICSVLQI